VFNDWYLVAVAVDWDVDVKQSTVQLYSNNSNVGSGIFPVPVLDSPNYVHLIGAELNINASGIEAKGGFYHGFIWEFCAYATAKNDFTPDIDTVARLVLVRTDLSALLTVSGTSGSKMGLVHSAMAVAIMAVQEVKTAMYAWTSFVRHAQTGRLVICVRLTRQAHLASVWKSSTRI
jgi:hypothetical protein